ncbi:hypothetical protein KDE12_06825 [Campylobacter sp. faydin G-105]|uniref:hypothetical protein n=1 Tax=Campylobacter anatolicus TaxID=2829105 RepID=UPI001B97190F|nr:hypothetical protein [Campylobacter anatolicus]MBR8462565.1 hypothetical protein [Campylobacter anatolicus]
MRKFILFATFIALFTACSNKNIIHEPLKNEILAYTSKSELIDGQDRTLIIATYLNPIYQSKISIANQEKFLVAINPKESEIDVTSITLNNENNGTTVRMLESNDELLGLSGFNMPWSRYYEITAPTKIADKLTLKFNIITCETCPSKQVLLEFQKVAKSLYWNE